jgi:lysophospholipase L1-like esterase
MLRRFLVLVSVLVVALSMIGASALRASADETPPTLSPTQGPAGTHVTASATDWPGCSSMSVSGWGQTTLGTAAVSSSGAFTLSFTVPGNAPLGAAQLVFMPTCSHSTILTVATFTVTQGTPPAPSCTPSVSLTPNSGAVGSTFVMAGKGWLPGGTVTITLPSTVPGFFESTTPFTPKVAADGTWKLTAIVGKPSSAGGYTFTFAESGCASQTGTFTVTASLTVSVPAAPSNLTATAVDQHDIKLIWHDNSSNETGFEINNGVTSRNAGANSTTYTWGGLAPGTYMCFKIRSYNSAGDSAWDPNVSPWYVCTTTPKPKPPTVTSYAALGDSYSAGLGNSPAYPNGVPNCGQSVKAYPALLDAAVPSLGKLGFIACENDVTDDFYTNGKNLSQLDALGLLPNVRTVTLTIGGNDIGFASVITDCAINPQILKTDCNPRWKAKVNAWINALAGKGSATTINGQPIHALATLLAGIHQMAPNARIFLAGYPRLFGTNAKYYTLLKGHGTPGTRVCYLPSVNAAGLRPLVRYDDAQWFDQTADTLNGVLTSAVAKARSKGVPVTFVSVRAAFTTHGDCDSGSSWLTPFNGLDRGTSLHPTAAGQQAYEKLLLAAGI